MSKSSEVKIPIGNLKNVVPKIPKNENIWKILSLAVLALIIIILIGKNLGGFSSVNADEIGSQVVDFANAQGAGASLVQVNDYSKNLYEIVLEVEGDQVPVYATKDGKHLIPTIVPLN